MAAPAGMGRVEFLEISVNAGLGKNESSGCAAAVIPVGLSGFHIGTGAGWNSYSDTGTFQLSGSYVIAGDPIGFMAGLFGPSMATGVSARYQYADSTGEDNFDVDAGFQFSLFPSFALGMNFTDILEDRTLTTGFSHVFNRNLKAHTTFGDGNWQIGCELAVTRALKLYSGTGGEDFNAGVSFAMESWNFGYGAMFHENEIQHKFGISRRFQ